MKIGVQICLGLALLQIGHVTKAQVHPCGGPGPGEVVVGQSEASNGLAPVPLCRSVDQQATTDAQAPSLKWESRWGAIATDEPNGVLASVTDMQSKGSAEKSVMDDCKAKGGKNCKLETWYSNGCAVLVLGDHLYNVTARTSLADATSDGIKICSANGETGCHVYFKACSSPALVH